MLSLFKSITIKDNSRENIYTMQSTGEEHDKGLSCTVVSCHVMSCYLNDVFDSS